MYLFSFINLFLVDGQGSSKANNAVSSNRSASLETILPTDPFTEETVKEIEALGFIRTQVIAELRRLNGDKAQATAALLAKSLKF